ncbi:MAG: transposase, partial [Nitrosomonas sp.]
MAMNRIQFQAGLSLPAFLAQFGTDEQCADALEAFRWPQGFSCPGCGTANYYLLTAGK